MISIIILFVGMFWESGMDIIGDHRSYKNSCWRSVSDYFDRNNMHAFGSQFWDNTISWANKWKNNESRLGEAFVGSSTIFVTIMDGWHLVKFLWLMHVFTAIVFYSPITNYFVVDIILFYLVYGLGHELFSKLQKISTSADK